MNQWFVRGAALLGLIFAAVTGAEAEPIAEGAEHCVVNVRSDDVLNMREQPNSRARVRSRLRYGTCGIFVQDECRGNWCPVEDGHNTGWVHRHYIAMVSPAMYCATGIPPRGSLVLRAYPSPQSRVLTRLDRRQCEIAFLPYAVGGWQKIRVDGWQGWVERRNLSGE
ncbi:SH3 domain-containing protein [Chelativorans sp. J32]|uniref:SH3 domain-containing protein n=1 Tax=Chelativorans sp. J32 TaxID=935840 RepID=UPI0004AFBAAA|nr:SH3 domain-containing protein [Chelativorans sp. J32]